MKIVIGLVLAILVIAGLWVYSNSPKESTAVNDLKYDVSEYDEAESCINELSEIIYEQTQIIKEVQHMTQVYDEDYESLYSLVEEIIDVTDVNTDDYRNNCSDTF